MRGNLDRRVVSTAGVLLMTASALAQSGAAPSVARLEPVGRGLYEVAIGESTNAVYIASTGPGERRIFVLDPRTLAVTASISTDRQPAFGLAFNNRTRTLYTTNTRSSSVSAIDVASGQIKATIQAPDGGGAHVFRALVDEPSNTVYVSLPGTPSRIWVIDGATNTLRHEIPNTGGRSTGLALDRAANRLYTCSIASSEILEIDLASRQVVRRFPSGGQGTTHLVFDAASNRLFATHQRSGEVTVLDPGTGRVLKSIPTGAGALGLALDGHRALLYVANRLAGTVSVIDTRRLEMVTTLKAGSMPNSVAVDSRTGSAFVTFKAAPRRPGDPPDSGGDTVALIEKRKERSEK